MLRLQGVNNYEKEVYNGDPGHITAVDAQARRVTVHFRCSASGAQPLPSRRPALSPPCAAAACTCPSHHNSSLLHDHSLKPSWSTSGHMHTRTASSCHPEMQVHERGDGGAGAGGKEVTYVGPDLWELELAWVTTVHKAQGSESRAVVIALSPAHRPLLTRRLLYTGALALPLLHGRHPDTKPPACLSRRQHRMMAQELM